MDLTTILIIVGVAVLVILIIAVIFIRISNKKRFKRLQDNIKKYKNENDNLGKDDKVKISDDQSKVENVSMVEQYVPEDETPSYQNNSPIIEDYDEVTEDDDDDIPDFIPRRRYRDERRNVYGRERRASMLNKNHLDSNDDDEDDDFEEFLNEHSYSRKILNNDLLKNLKDLPPDVKAIILSNVFNKFDD